MCSYVRYAEIEPNGVSWQGGATKACWQGALYLGLPYLVWLAWRRPQELVGRGSDTAGAQTEPTPGFGGVGGFSGRQLAAVGVSYGLLVLTWDISTGLDWVGLELPFVEVMGWYGPSPFAVGPFGIILGIFGRARGARRLGVLAIAVGTLSTIIGIAMITYANWLTVATR